MLTERGSIKTSSVSVSPALDMYRKKFKIISIIMLIAGAIGLVAYFAVSTVWEKKWFDALLIFAAPFTLGLIGTITIVRLHSREKKDARESHCEFFDDCFFYSIEEVGRDKFDYSDAVLKSENEKYGYIYVFSKGVFFPFCKDDLTTSELNAIRRNFRKTIPDGEDVAKLEKFKEE